jgi:drug/metabolite transporter (DMT)-like permease
MNDPQSPVSDGMKIGIAILSFFIPIVGIIMGLIYMNDAHPDKKAAGKLWLIVGGIMIVLNLVCTCGFVVLGLAAGGA